MNEVQVITFMDKIDNRSLLLRKSCKQYNLPLTVLIPDVIPWNNLYTLKVLHEHVAKLPAKTICLVVDAFDVVILGDSEQLASHFLSLESELVFSTEYFFYLRDKRNAKVALFDTHPGKQHLYPYLNAGAYMGYAGSLCKHLKKLEKDYGIRYNDHAYLERHTSDQSLLIRYYLDNYTKFKQSQFSDFKLDHTHTLFETTGGRRRIHKTPLTNPIKDMLYARYERRFALKRNSNLLQDSFLDLKFNSATGCLQNTRQNTQPLVLHIPGCKSNNDFAALLQALKQHRKHIRLKWYIKKVAIMISARIKTEITYYSGKESVKKRLV